MDENRVGLANDVEHHASDFRLQLLCLAELHAHVQDKFCEKVGYITCNNILYLFR